MPLPTLSRRRFLQLGLCASLPPTGVVGYARFIEPHNLEVVQRSLPIANLPSALVGRKLVHISDLHICRVDDDYMHRALKMVNDTEPDLLAITGDITDCYYGVQLDRTMRMLEDLRIPPLGIVCCLGNHDYGLHWRQYGVADELTDRLCRMNYTVLRNEVIDIEGLRIGGVDELWAARSRPQRVISQLTPDRAAIVLAHNPDLVDCPEWLPFKGWTLSGHTHGGQVKLPFVGFTYLPVRNRRYACGIIDTDHGGKLHVSPGIGYTRPVRFRVPPQITIFSLATAEA